MFSELLCGNNKETSLKMETKSRAIQRNPVWKNQIKTNKKMETKKQNKETKKPTKIVFVVETSLMQSKVVLEH